MSEAEQDHKCEDPGAPAWMATFGDLMSLLLTFFVLLMSFASMDVRRFAVMAGSIKEAFGVQRVHPGDIPALSTSIVEFSDTESTPFLRVIDVPSRLTERDQSLMARIQMALKEHDLERIMQVESTTAGVVLRVPGKMLFEPGSAQLQPEAVVFLHDVASLIREAPGEVSIEGHTDPSPVGADSDRTNWHLSTDRAVAALVHLVEVEGIDSGRLRAAGYGAARPLEEGGELSASRRVEFVFLRDPADERRADWTRPEPENDGERTQP